MTTLDHMDPNVNREDEGGAPWKPWGQPRTDEEGSGPDWARRADGSVIEPVPHAGLPADPDDELDPDEGPPSFPPPDADPSESWASPPRERIPADEFATVDGAAQVLLVRSGHRMRHAPGLGSFVFDGRYWVPDPGEALSRALAMDAAREYSKRWEAHTERGNGKNQEGLDPSFRFCLSLLSDRGARAILATAQIQEPILCSADEFDDGAMAGEDAAYLFNVQNGTIDLRTNTIKPHDPEDMITRIAPVTFDRDARCPEFDRFLSEAQPDPEVRSFLARCAGLMLLGKTPEQFWILLLGPRTANGKTTWIEAVKHLMGDYGRVVSTKVLLQGDAHATIFHRFKGARLAYIDEPETRTPLNEAKVKALTGGSTLVANQMHKDEVSWTPTHTLVVTCNELPAFQGGHLSPAMRRRTKVVEWLQSFEDRMDVRLPEKLRGEAAGILNWCLAGFLDYQERAARGPNAMAAPACVELAGRTLASEEDSLAQFVEDRCVLGPDEKVAQSDLFKQYLTYCKENGFTGAKNETKNNVTRRLKAMNMGVTNPENLRVKKKRGYKGIDLVPLDADDYQSKHDRYGT